VPRFTVYLYKAKTTIQIYLLKEVTIKIILISTGKIKTRTAKLFKNEKVIMFTKFKLPSKPRRTDN